MYTKEESTRIKTMFWTTFGQYMKPVPGVWKEKTNWLNYKTGIKHIYFRMHADSKHAAIGIEITHKDAAIRQLIFEKMEQLKPVLEAATGEQWQWNKEDVDELGMPISTIQLSLEKVNVMQKESWPAIIRFFKPRLIALDAFWADAKDIVEMTI